MYIRLCNRVESETIIRKLFVCNSKHYNTLSRNTNNDYTKITILSIVRCLKHIVFTLVHQNRTWRSQLFSLPQLLPKIY